MTAILPPNLSYLDRIGSTVLDATGAGLIVLGPDVGQYWLPIIAQANVKSPTGNVLGKPTNCYLYAGTGGGIPDATFLKDFTTHGANDTSTILSGSIIPPGLKIAFSFADGVPGEIASGRIIGLSSVIPPTEGIVPEVPGARFIGGTIEENVPTGLLTSSVLQSTSGNVFYPRLPMGIARNVSIDFAHLGGVGGGPIAVFLEWYADGAQTKLVSTDVLSLRVSGQSISQTWPVKGRYLQALVQPQGAVPVSYTLKIFLQSSDWKFTWDYNTLYLLDSGSAGVVLAPGVTTTLAFRVGYGPAHFFFMTDATDATFELQTRPAGTAARNLVRGTQAFPQGSHILFLPPHSTQIVIDNNDAVNRTFWYSLVTNLGGTGT